MGEEGRKGKKTHVVHVFLTLSLGASGLQAPMVFLCRNDVLGGCNIAPPTSQRHLPATSERGLGHPPSTSLGMGKLPVQRPDADGEPARVKTRGGQYGKSGQLGQMCGSFSSPHNLSFWSS